MIRVVVGAFNMRLMVAIMDMILDVGVLALIVIFQPEIRKFLIRLGNRYMSSARGQKILRRILGKGSTTAAAASEEVNDLTEACRRMSEEKTGALIVIEQGDKLGEIINTGESIDAAINQLLIENIFFKNSPLHDGAMVISQKRIVAAGCLLPVSHSMEIPKSLGLRHRAALGVSQESDAFAIVVSEETGAITVAHRGTLHRWLTAEQLEKLLFELE
jgi:uncharacterized protein (TIGR00159 family)